MAENNLTSRTDLPAARPGVIWLPQSITRAGLTPGQRLVALAAVDLADNRTGLLTWNRTRLGQRCGDRAHPRSPKFLAEALKELEAIGILTIERPAGGPRSARVRVARVHSKKRFEIPRALFWAGAGEPLRAPTFAQAEKALTACLALVARADFDTRFVEANLFELAGVFAGNVTMHGGDESRTRLGRDTISDAMHALEELAGPAVKVERNRVQDGRHTKNTYSFDWSLLPPYEAEAQTVEPPCTIPRAEFMTKAAAAAATTSVPEVVELVATFHERQTDLAHRLIAPTMRPRQIGVAWLADMSAIVADGVPVERVKEVIDFAFQHDFWRSNVQDPGKLRQHFERMVADSDFLKWREKAGLVEWSDEIKSIVKSMQSLLDFTHPGDQHDAEPEWFRGASRLLTKYSKIQIEDMMEWSLSSAKHVSNVRWLLVHEWIPTSIRDDYDFIMWAQSRGRDWAKDLRAVEAPSGRPRFAGGKEQAKRIGGTVASDDVFLALAAQAGSPSAVERRHEQVSTALPDAEDKVPVDQQVGQSDARWFTPTLRTMNESVGPVEESVWIEPLGWVEEEAG